MPAGSDAGGMKKRMKTGRLGRAYWERTIARFKRSGLSHEAFCERERCNVGTFRGWLYRLRSGNEAPEVEPEFVEVVAGEAGASRVCRLRVGSVEVSFDALPEAGYVASLVRALGE